MISFTKFGNAAWQLQFPPGPPLRKEGTQAVLFKRAVNGRFPLFILALVVILLSACGSEKYAAPTSGGIYQGTQLDTPSPDFRLADHTGAPLALSDLRGKVVALAFLDPECTDVCPLTANEFRLTSESLGRQASAVAFLVVNVNPKANSIADVAKTTQRWGVEGLANWHFLTGSREELTPVYKSYSILAEGPPKQGKPQELEHTAGVYIIDQSGNERWYLSTAFDPAVSLHELLVKHIKALLG